MKHCIRFWKHNKKTLNTPIGMQFGIIANIYRQKKIINNSKKYTEDEKILIMKGLDLAKDRAWTVFYDIEVL